MKKTVKKFVFAVLNCVAAFAPKSRAAILLYHAVDKSDLHLTVSPEYFARQMEYLAAKNYNVISLQELYDILRNRRQIPSKTVVITFDDGYESRLREVLPVLKKHHFSASFFIPVDLLGKKINNSENKPQPVMDERQLQKLEESPLTDIHSHTLSHRELPKLDSAKHWQEIAYSKNKLEDLLKQKESWAFAYPRGKCNDDLKSKVQKAGYKLAVTVEEGAVNLDSDRYALPRNTINSETSMAEFKFKLSSASRLLIWVRRAK